MQLHFSPSMRSITISSTNNGFIDLMKIKVAARHISYRTLFHTILILAFLLPFVFILTALVTLEGVNKCSSFGTLLITPPLTIYIRLDASQFDCFLFVSLFLVLFKLDLGLHLGSNSKYASVLFVCIYLYLKIFYVFF